MYITTFAFLNIVNVSLLLLSESWPVMTASSKAQEKYELRGKSFSCLEENERMGRDREQTSSNSITSILTTRTGERMNQTGQIAIVKLKTLPTQNKKQKEKFQYVWFRASNFGERERFLCILPPKLTRRM